MEAENIQQESQDFNQQILDNLLAPIGETIEIVDPVVVVDAPIVQETPSPLIPQAPPYNPMWDFVVGDIKKHDANYDIPEIVKKRVRDDGTQISPEDEYKMLVSEISKYNKPEIDDPTIEDYLIIKDKEGISFEEFVLKKIERQAIAKADDKTFMKHFLKLKIGKSEANPNGLSDEQIEDNVLKMEASGVLELNANINRDNYQQLLQQADLAERDLRQSRYDEKLSLAQANQLAMIDQLLEKKKEIKNVFGVEVSEAQRSEFHKAFKDLLSIDKETGVPKVHEYLSDDDTLHDVLFFMHLKKQGALQEYITRIKENVKQTYIDKLQIEPTDNNQRSPVSPTGVDLNKMLEPEGY